MKAGFGFWEAEVKNTNALSVCTHLPNFKCVIRTQEMNREGGQEAI